MLRCSVCSKNFVAGDDVLTFYLQKVGLTEDNELGLFEHLQYPEDYVDRVHFEHKCLEQTFSPADNPFMYDKIYDEVCDDIESQLREELSEQIREEIEEELGLDIPNYEDQEPDQCIWCKKNDCVWRRVLTGGIIFYCTRCNKMWDDEENEVEPSS